MNRLWIVFASVWGLGVAFAGGCGDSTPVTCEGTVCPCSEGGIRAAVAEGGGPFTFDCDGAQTVATGATIVLESDVILDGEGKLTIDGRGGHRVFRSSDVVVELRRLTVFRGSLGPPPTAAASTEKIHATSRPPALGAGIYNQGTMKLIDCTISESTTDQQGGGIYNDGTLEMLDSRVSRNAAGQGGGIYNNGTLVLINTVVSRNTAWFGGGLAGGEGVNLYSTITLVNSTVSENTALDGTSDAIANAGALSLHNTTVSGNIPFLGMLVSTNSVVEGACEGRIDWDAASGGYNVESPGNTCGFNLSTDQVSVSADDLKLGPLQDNGGPTETHALGEGSVAIDVIPEAECVDAEGEPLTTDQRGLPRGTMCDVGAFERQPDDQ